VTADKTLLIEPHRKHVQIVFDGRTVADTHQSILLIESYAPDIYIPIEHIDMELMVKADTKTHCETKGDASYWTLRSEKSVAQNAMWSYETPLLSCRAIAGHGAFDFNQVDTFVDGQLVRGHVRDPNKTITTEPMSTHLQMQIGGQMIVDSMSWVMLYETGLPARHYVPVSDVNPEFLLPSARQSVCTYKGEAVYHHVQVADTIRENVVWSYPNPWLDFSQDVRRIAGLFGLYSSAFDQVSVDGRLLETDEAASRADEAMQSTPTIDATLSAKLNA